MPNPREWQPIDADWKLPPDWKHIILDGMKERLQEVSLLPAVHGHLRALRRLRRQVPLLYRLRRSEEHAGAARRTDALGLPPLLHLDRPPLRRARGRARADRRRHQGMVLLLLPVHGMPPLLGLLPLRHRHGRNHHDRPRAAEPDRLQHQLGAGAGRQLLPHRQSSGHPAARLQGQPRFCRRRSCRRSPACRSKFRSIARAPRFCSSCPRPTTSARRITTRCSAT